VDSEEDENDRIRMEAAHDVASSIVMDIEESEGISVQVPDLLDLLSDSPMLRTLTLHKVKPKALASSKKENSQEPKVFQVSDIQF